MFPRKPPRSGPTPDINVTPLVDVCLVLLIIFMVVMPQLQQGGQVDPPRVRNPDPRHEAQMDPVTVTITANGQYLLEGQPMSLDGALAQLGKLRSVDPDRRLRLKGDRNIEYGKVRTLFARCQKLGFRGIALIVTSKEEEKDLSKEKGAI
jgi:biopolymer transport protein TolR